MATNKLLWSSKLIGVFFIMLVCTLSANAQFLRTSYFMEGTHYRQQLNPALTPTKGYFNLPVIGAVNATVGSTSLGYQDIIDIIDDGDDFYTKPDFMNRLKDNNKGEFYQFNLSSCIRQQNSLTAQFVSFSLSNLANIFYPPPIFTIINLCLL